MISRLRSAILTVALLTAMPALAAGPPPAGATSCSGCHATGDTPGPVPAITGRAVDDIVTAMAEFRDGKRPATVMDRISKGFTPEETRAIAAWLAEAK